MLTIKKDVWIAPKKEKSLDDGDILVGEREEEKKNFSSLVEAPEKGKSAPLMSRVTASTNISTTNTNFSDGGVLTGADYSHKANSFIVGPANAQKFSSSIVRHSFNMKGNLNNKRVVGRGAGRGR